MKIPRFTTIPCLFFLVAGNIFAQNQPITSAFLEFDLPPAIWPMASERAKLQADDSPEKQAVIAYLREIADRAFGRRPNPTDSIFYEGLVSNHPKRLAAAAYLEDMRLLHALIWSYLLTGEKKYALKAENYLWAWATVYHPTGNDVNENKLTPCFLTYALRKEQMPRRKRVKTERWLADIAARQKQGWRLGETAGNRDAKRLKLILILGLALDDEDLQRFALDRSREVLAKALFADGRSHDLERRDAMHYHVSCVNGLLELSLIARNAGVDLYRETTPAGASIQKSVEYTLPYVRGERIHPEWTNSKVALDHRRGASGDPYYRPGKPWDPLEAVDMLTMASIYDPQFRLLLNNLKTGSETGEERFLAYVAQVLAQDH